MKPADRLKLAEKMIAENKALQEMYMLKQQLHDIQQKKRERVLTFIVIWLFTVFMFLLYL